MQPLEPPRAGEATGAGRAPNGARPFGSDPADELRIAAIGELSIDSERYTVTLGGEPVELTFTEFHALWALARRDGRVVGADELAEELWGDVPHRARRRIAVTISRLRGKLGPVGAGYIRTVHRVGYRLAPPA